MNGELMHEIVEAFLATKFESLERRVRRINRLDEREDYD
jgi:ribose 5-phosphate isomerase RpiB